MSVPVVTAVTNAAWEAELVAALDGAELGVNVVRRCVDVADLLATAAAGTARAVVLSADLRRLDGEVLARLRASRIAVVGLVEPGNDDAERRLRQLGVADVLPANASPAAIAASLSAAATVTRNAGQHSGAKNDHSDRLGLSNPQAALPPADALPPPPELSGTWLPGGYVVAVWGPTGAPGRSTVALGLADEIARSGIATLLVDADCYGAALAQQLGMMDEAPGLAAAVRLENQGALDVAALAGLARMVGPRLLVLTGISRPDRWPELRAEAVRGVIAKARMATPVTIVDCGFCLEDDEELSYDTMAPRRNGSTLAALSAADIVIVVGAGDPVGMHRLVRGLSDLTTVLPDVAGRIRVVVNQVRRGPIPGNPEQEIATALHRFAGVTQLEVLPHDRSALDRALARGATLAEAAPDSPLRSRLRRLAGMLVASLSVYSASANRMEQV